MAPHRLADDARYPVLLEFQRSVGSEDVCPTPAVGPTIARHRWSFSRAAGGCSRNRYLKGGRGLSWESQGRDRNRPLSWPAGLQQSREDPVEMSCEDEPFGRSSSGCHIPAPEPLGGTFPRNSVPVALYTDSPPTICRHQAIALISRASIVKSPLNGVSKERPAAGRVNCWPPGFLLTLSFNGEDGGW